MVININKNGGIPQVVGLYLTKHKEYGKKVLLFSVLSYCVTGHEPELKSKKGKLSMNSTELAPIHTNSRDNESPSVLLIPFLLC